MSVASYLEKNKDRFLQELIDLLRIPSVSADPKFKGEVVAAANFVKNYLEKAGADLVEICETPGFPIVYGEKIIDPRIAYCIGLWPLRCTACRSLRTLGLTPFRANLEENGHPP